jgi:hypothetical protein
MQNKDLLPDDVVAEARGFLDLLLLHVTAVEAGLNPLFFAACLLLLLRLVTVTGVVFLL